MRISDWSSDVCSSDRPGVAVAPFMHGGGQEGPGLRSGTLSPALCAGFGAAAAVAKARMEGDLAHVGQLWTRALEAIGGEWRLNGSADARYRGNLNLQIGRASCRDRVCQYG